MTACGRRVNGLNPVANPGALLQEEPDGWALLFNPDSAGALALNPTGVVVWKLINGRRSAADIAQALSCRFAGAPETVEADVAVLLKVLAEEGFVGYEFGDNGHERGSAPVGVA
jgi:hypothetical protein